MSPASSGSMTFPQKGTGLTGDPRQPGAITMRASLFLILLMSEGVGATSDGRV